MKLLLLFLLAGCGVEHQLDKGREAIENRELIEAEIAFRSALSSEPDRPEALYGLGWTYHLAGKQEQSREIFKQCIEVAPDSHLGYKGLGSVALSEGNLGSAEEAFENALLRSPADPAVSNSLGLLYLRLDRTEEALQLYEKTESQPAFAVGHAEALLRLEREDEALALVEEALEDSKSSPAEALLHQTRARVLLKVSAGRIDAEHCESAQALLSWLDEADRSLQKAEALQPKLPDLFTYQRAVHQRRQVIYDLCPQSRK